MVAAQNRRDMLRTVACVALATALPLAAGMGVITTPADPETDAWAKIAAMCRSSTPTPRPRWSARGAPV
jgi:hypothetical protein